MLFDTEIKNLLKLIDNIQKILKKKVKEFIKIILSLENKNFHKKVKEYTTIILSQENNRFHKKEKKLKQEEDRILDSNHNMKIRGLILEVKLRNMKEISQEETLEIKGIKDQDKTEIEKDKEETIETLIFNLIQDNHQTQIASLTLFHTQ